MNDDIENWYVDSDGTKLVRFDEWQFSHTRHYQLPSTVFDGKGKRVMKADGQQLTAKEFSAGAWQAVRKHYAAMKARRDALFAIGFDLSKKADVQQCVMDPTSELDALEWIATIPTTMAPILARLALNEAASVRYFAAENAKTYAATLTALAGDDDPHVRCAVGQNGKTLVSVLRGLAEDHDIRVRVCARANPKLI